MTAAPMAMVGCGHSVGEAAMGIQWHVLAMFVANIAPILIVAGAVKMSPEESGALVQSAMIVAGLGSLLQMFPLFLNEVNGAFLREIVAFNQNAGCRAD